ncbi:hypothetical protein [Actinocatenispora rupis]|uniref:Uncharacterized protein n=1 Tax=Actinocatenispora rupis TaxID=519421 RepID=A0A8J3JFQ7_9ACTN|nr:hypothetical protein [Actinocatenispora rupis]GID15834.1 hypothetical protein Aru02nite_67230 [Actinocatenispora rupis]
MSRADLQVDTESIRASVHTLDKRVADLRDAMRTLTGLEHLGPPPLGTFPHAKDAVAWYSDIKTGSLERIGDLLDALTALRDGNATIAEAYERVERGTHTDIHRHQA